MAALLQTRLLQWGLPCTKGARTVLTRNLPARTSQFEGLPHEMRHRRPAQRR